METTKDATVGAVENLEGQNKEAVTYTVDDFQKKLQSETDKRVTVAIKTAKVSWEEEFKRTLEKEKDEAAKMAKMTEAQRKEAEFKKEQELFENERQQFKKERLELEVVKELGNRGLSTKFSNFQMGDDAEASIKNIEDFEEVFKSEVDKRVKERLGGKAPTVSTTSKETSKQSDIVDFANKNRIIK